MNGARIAGAFVAAPFLPTAVAWAAWTGGKKAWVRLLGATTPGGGDE